MTSKGHDYGMGTTNIDNETGIRYGVISQHEVLQAWADSSEGDYGPPTCGKCGNDAVDIDADGVPDLDEEHDWDDDGRDYACLNCRRTFDSDEAYGDEPLKWTLDDGEYKAQQSRDDGDIFIIKSPYYTLCEFCSPCAPGAGYIMNTVEDGVKAYCFGHDWFDGGKAPYPVYRVDNNEPVYA